MSRRPTEEQKEATAEAIREGNPLVTAELVSEEETGVGVLSGGTPILDEAATEEAEGGGPIAEAVKEFDQQTADAVGD
jgi:hypothetical protein